MDRQSPNQSVTEASSADRCPGCQQELLGSYCHHCGERRFDQSELTFRHIMTQLFTSLTDVDGKLWVSLRLLVSRPGQLTLDYLQGRRKQRLTPFQLFVLVNVFFFLVVGWMGNSAYTTPLNFHLNSVNFIHQPTAVELVEQHLKQSQLSLADYAQRFDQVAALQAKSLVFLIIPMLSLVVLALHWRKRHGVTGELVFATHLFTWMLLVQAVVAPLVLYGLLWLAHHTPLSLNEVSFEVIYSLCLLLCVVIYYGLAARRVYQHSKGITLIQCLLMSLAIYWITLIYRMILFFTTFWVA